jgi:fibronectin type 3 domain-containing protein
VKRASFLSVAILAVLISGIVGVVLFRVRADQKVHSVLLKWEPPREGLHLASYNVYRSRPDGTYEPIASGLTVTTYTDHKVRRRETYSYYVRAVDTAGRESAPSNQASATIP